MRGLVTGSAVLAVLLCTATLFAGGDPNYILSASDDAGSTGAAVSTTVTIDSTAGSAVQGWSFGVCSDETILTVDNAATTPAADMLNGGAPLGFANIGINPGGATLGVVIDLFGINVLAPSVIDVFTIDYTIVGTVDASLDFCSTLGTPPVSTVVVVGGASIPPTTLGGLIDVIDPNELRAGSANGLLGSTVDTVIQLENATLGAVDAVQVAMTYDAAIIGNPSVANTVGADFVSVQPGAAGDLVIGLLMDDGSDGMINNQIPASPSTTDLLTVTWDGLTVGTSALTLTDGIGSPATNNGLFIGQDPLYQPTLVNGSVNIVNFNPFVRGDCNNDATVNIADGVYGLNFLFQGGPAPTCDDACDSNDDALIDAADAIYIFNWAFLDGPAPLAPFPTADLDPTQGDGLGCNGDADDL